MAKDSGVWLDRESGKIVTTQPARGRQIVAPGKEMNAKHEAMVERYEQNAGTTAVEQATAPEPVETREDTSTAKTTTSKSSAKSSAKKGS